METTCLCAAPQVNPPLRRCSSASTTRAVEWSSLTVWTSGRWTPLGSGVMWLDSLARFVLIKCQRNRKRVTGFVDRQSQSVLPVCLSLPRYWSQSFCLYDFIPVCLIVCFYTYPFISVYISICLSVCVSICLGKSLLFRLSLTLFSLTHCLSLSICMPFCVSPSLSHCISVICLFAYLPVCFFFFLICLYVLSVFPSAYLPCYLFLPLTAGAGALRHLCDGEYPIWEARCHRRWSDGCSQAGQRPHLHHQLPRRLWHRSGSVLCFKLDKIRITTTIKHKYFHLHPTYLSKTPYRWARCDAVRWAEAEDCHRSSSGEEPQRSDSGRGHQCSGRRVGASGAGGAGPSHRGTYRSHHRPPPQYHPGGGPYLRHEQRQSDGGGEKKR